VTSRPRHSRPRGSLSKQNAENRHVVLACFGTDGDVYPFLGLGGVLRERGYRVTLATQGEFAQRAQNAGLEFYPLVPQESINALLEQPEMWHPLKGPVAAARAWIRGIEEQYAALKSLATQGETMLVTHPAVVAARILEEREGIPLVSVILQPWMIPSVHAPPVMMGGWTLPRWTPTLASKLFFRFVDGAGDWLIGDEINRVRASLHLKPVRRIFQWWYSPDLVLGMFPEWYAPPQIDWPSQMSLTGFPVSDGQAFAEVPAPIREFCQAGKPPIAITFGTGMMHATDAFRECLEACESLGTRAIFLAKFPSQLPKELPPFSIRCDFAPFQKLFPLCSAVVHHGGIGTTAKALAAGVPQLILPFAFDQMDNAHRVKQLGAGEGLGTKKRSTVSVKKALAGLQTAEAAARARAVAARFDGASGLDTAADAVEQSWRQVRMD
jgi:rhamnosyltransferase subunit B